MALGFNMEEIMAISGKLAPVPPIIKAMAAPILIPLTMSAFSIGIAISMRKYKGTPMVAAIGMASGLSFPRYFSTHASGTNTAEIALITAPRRT